MNDRAAERRALADKIRHDHAESTQRKRIVTMIIVVVGVLACAAVLVWLQFQPSDDDPQLIEPANASESYGFTLTPELATESDDFTETPLQVSLYEDYLCPSCKIFHEESGAFLAEQVSTGKISLTYHPFTFLLKNSTDEYTQRAANAAVCVGDAAGPVGYALMHGLLMQHQPTQGGAGLTDAQLIEFGVEAGADDIAECVEERRFTPWIEEALQSGQAAGVTMTPTVRVEGMTVVRSDDGRESMPGPDEIQFAIESIQ